MGLFSKLFGKKLYTTNTANDNKNISISFNVGSSFNDCIPALQGDYAKTIFLWGHDKAGPIVKDDECSRYIKYECGIVSPSMYHQFLVEEGYYVPASAYSMLSTLKVTELKKILSNLGCLVSGKKDVLISRLVDSLTRDEIESLFGQQMYELSDMGRSFLKAHNNYILLHKHKIWGIDWFEFDEAHIQGCSFYDTAWRILNERAVQDQHCCGRIQYYHMYELLKEEGKREYALEMLLRVFYIDLSGAGCLNTFRLYHEGIWDKDHLANSFYTTIMIAPGIIEAIQSYKDVYSDDIVDRLYEWKLPIHICTKELFLEIVHSIIDGSFVVKKAEEKLRGEYCKFISYL